MDDEEDPFDQEHEGTQRGTEADGEGAAAGGEGANEAQSSRADPNAREDDKGSCEAGSAQAAEHAAGGRQWHTAHGAECSQRES